jgi:hypothetical protein
MAQKSDRQDAAQRDGRRVWKSNGEENSRWIALAIDQTGSPGGVCQGDEDHSAKPKTTEQAMTYESYIKGRLMDLVIEEAYASGGVIAMLAVAQVIYNRVQAGWQGGDWLRVITTAPDYRGTTPAPVSNRIDPRNGNFRELMRQIDDVYYGTADDTNVNTEKGKSLYYVELHNVDRPWFQEQILQDQESHPRLAHVGQLTFFG